MITMKLRWVVMVVLWLFCHVQSRETYGSYNDYHGVPTSIPTSMPTPAFAQVLILLCFKIGKWFTLQFISLYLFRLWIQHSAVLDSAEATQAISNVTATLSADGAIRIIVFTSIHVSKIFAFIEQERRLLWWFCQCLSRTETRRRDECTNSESHSWPNKRTYWPTFMCRCMWFLRGRLWMLLRLWLFWKQWLLWRLRGGENHV